MEVKRERAPGVARQRFITPYGEVCFGRILSDKVSGTTDQGLPLEHPIHSVDDYKVLEYIAEHTYYDRCYDEYLKYEAAVGARDTPWSRAGTSRSITSCLHLCRIQPGLLRNGRSRRGVRAPHRRDGAGRAGATVARRGRFPGAAHPARGPLRFADDAAAHVSQVHDAVLQGLQRVASCAGKIAGLARGRRLQGHPGRGEGRRLRYVRVLLHGAHGRGHARRGPRRLEE